jgi:hypothetical protein
MVVRSQGNASGVLCFVGWLFFGTMAGVGCLAMIASHGDSFSLAESGALQRRQWVVREGFELEHSGQSITTSSWPF